MIWLVGDSPLILAGLADHIRGEGQDLKVFSSFREALSKSKSQTPSTLLCGTSDPLFSYPLLNQIREKSPQMPFVLWGASDNAIRAEIGPLHFIVAPPSFSELWPRVLHLQEVQRLKRELGKTKKALSRIDEQLEVTHIELETATERLVQAEQLAAVGRGIAGIANEVQRNLALIGYAEAIKTRVAPDSELVELADVIIHAQKRLSAMVQELRDFTSREFSLGMNEEIHREPADLATVVRDSIYIVSFDHKYKNRNVQIIVSEMPLVSLHRQKISQVIINLLENALYATNDDGEIVVRVDTWNSNARIRVCDNGEGMSEEVLSRLGELFFTTRGERASGLGIGMCMRIVEDHGGNLSFDSKIGEGTEATVILPLLIDEATSA